MAELDGGQPHAQGVLISADQLQFELQQAIARKGNNSEHKMRTCFGEQELSRARMRLMHEALKGSGSKLNFITSSLCTEPLSLVCGKRWAFLVWDLHATTSKGWFLVCRTKAMPSALEVTASRGMN